MNELHAVSTHRARLRHCKHVNNTNGVVINKFPEHQTHNFHRHSSTTMFQHLHTIHTKPHCFINSNCFHAIAWVQLTQYHNREIYSNTITLWQTISSSCRLLLVIITLCLHLPELHCEFSLFLNALKFKAHQMATNRLTDYCRYNSKISTDNHYYISSQLVAITCHRIHSLSF